MSFYLFNGERAPTSGFEGAVPISPAAIRRIVKWGLVVLGLIILFVLLSQAKSVYTDWLWFGSLGFRSVFSTILVLRIWLFVAGTAFFLTFLVANLYVAYRSARGTSILAVPPDMLPLIRLGAIAAVVVTVVIMSAAFGAVVTERWETFLLFFNKVSFGVSDPQFNKDISFYVAVLPLLHLIQGWLMGAVIAVMVAVIALYTLMYGVRGVQVSLTPRLLGHLAVLGALLMVSIAAAHFLDTFETLFSSGGVAYGASYVDVHARITVLRILTGVALLSGIGFIASIYFGGLRFMLASFGLWALFAIVVGVAYPAVVQRVTVDPDEFNKEVPYIERNLEATRVAYGLNDVQESAFEYTPVLSSLDVTENPQTISNIRLWDPIPLAANYNQIQFFELYYSFVGVDVDRYQVDGEIRQVMLGARELFPEDLPLEAQRWVNRKLQYTHGYGVAMSPVTEFTVEGGPQFYLQDIPPRGILDLEQPQIYYGENTTDFVIVKTKTKEFDFPGPEGAVYDPDPYQGVGGVSVGSFIRKLAFAWEFLDPNILISNQLTSESRVMYRRNIAERVAQVAPFLTLDANPYLVVADNKLWWIQDAYTTTDRYPYSTPSPQGFNYIRNSVKVVVDAYNGTLRFFIVDPDDAMIRMYQRAFPDLFEPVTEPDPFQAIQPSALRAHIRYPQDLFNIQARRYLQYHMRDPQVFFNKEDQWDFGNELFFDELQPVRPYYVIMKLPGETKEEFVLIMPFTPFEKKNMVAWMTARNDTPNYGQLQTFIFPTGSQVFGPEQIEGRITSDEAIGREFTLLCPQGKLCIRGNLLVIPLGNSILYVEPLFIRPQALDFPELKKVIVADGTSVVMADTLDEAIGQLVSLGIQRGQLAAQPPVGVPPILAPLPPLGEAPLAAPEAVQQLIDQIQLLLDQLEQELEGIGQTAEAEVQ